MTYSKAILTPREGYGVKTADMIQNIFWSLLLIL